MSSAASPFPPTLAASHDLLQKLLDVTPSSLALLAPVYAAGAAGELIDFRLHYLNRAAQRVTGQPAQPTATLLALFPQATEAGTFAFYREAYLSGQPRQATFDYHYHGFDDHYQLTAERSGDLLLVGSTATAGAPDRSDVEQALRESRAREQAARAEAEAERQRLHQVLMRMPANIALLHGPEHVYTLVNPEYERLFPARTTLGRSIREVIPELAGQGFYELFDQVYQTGEPYYAPEAEAWADYAGTGQPQRRYYRTAFEPIRDVRGRVTDVLNFAVDVTEQVEARQQVQQLNEELTAARAAAEHERNLLQALLAQAPVALALYQGDDMRVAAVNAQMAALWGRTPDQVLHQPLMETVPELRGQGFDDLMRQVLHTQQPVTGTETPATMLRDGELQTTYYNFVYQPIYDQQGVAFGVVNVAVEVTGHVLARRQVQQLNEELQASNTEYQRANEALREVQQQQQQLNQELETRVQQRTRELAQLNRELEARVQERTRETEAARAAAERQRGELWRVFEQAPIAIAVYRGPRYIIELANSTVARLWGRTQEQLLGKGLFEALPEVAGMGYEQLLDRVMATGEPYVAHAMEAQHDRNGHRETVYWDFVYVPMYAEDGSIYGAMVVATEVTAQVLARRRMEQLNQELEARVQERTQELQAALTDAEQQREQLRVQQGLLNGILGQVPAAIATLTGPEHRYTFFNELYQTLTADRTMMGLTVAEVLPELQEQGFVGLLDQVYATGEPFIGTDTPALLHDAVTGRPEQLYVDFIYQPLFDAQQRVQGILAFILDVTDRVLARQAVTRQQAEEQARLRQIFEQAPAPIFVLHGPDYVLEVVNEAMCEMLGQPTAQLLGRPFFEAVPELAHQGYPELLARVWRTGQPVAVQESPARLARHQPGETGYFTFVYQPIFDARQQLTDVLCVALDVTEQVEARQQVQQLNEELATINGELYVTNEELTDTNNQLTRINQDLDTFVYTASHDLKAPIANIEGLLDALRDYLPADGTEPMIPHLLGMMQGAVTRFQQTVGHLTDVAHLQHAQPPEVVPLASLLHDVRLDLAGLEQTTHAHFQLDLDACPTVYFAAKHLRSVLYNLLSNALKYRHPERPPVVRVRAYCEGEDVVLAVEDNGLGLTAAQQTKLFALFRRLHSHVEGSGVGLYMIKRIVENAGGSIAVDSVPEVGTTFTVRLPRASPAH